MIKKSKRLLSFFLSLLMLLTALPVSFLSASAGTGNSNLFQFTQFRNDNTNTSIGNRTDYRIPIASHTSAAGSACFSYAISGFNISGISTSSRLESAVLSGTIESYASSAIPGMKIAFHLIPNENLYNSTYAGPDNSAWKITTSGSRGTNNSLTPTAAYNPYSTLCMNLGLSDSTLIGNVPYGSTSYSFNMTEKINAARQAGINEIKIITVYTTANNDSKSTACWLNHPQLKFETTEIKTFNQVSRCCMKHGSTINQSNPDEGIYVRGDASESEYSYAAFAYNISSLTSLADEKVVSANLSGDIAYNSTDSSLSDLSIAFHLVPESYTHTTGTVGLDGWWNGNLYPGNNGIFSKTNDIGVPSESNNPYVTICNAMGLSSSTLIGEVTRDKTSYSFDIRGLLQSAKAAGRTEIRIVAIQTSVNTGAAASKCLVKNPVITAQTADASSITKYNDKNAVTGRISIDNVIYTNDRDDYRNYGTVISETEDYMTDYTISGDYTLSSIECMETDAVLDTRTAYGKKILIGDLKGSKFRVAGNKNVSATLKFTFDDDAVEYHRVAVKSTPVEAHAPIRASKGTDTFGHWESGLTTIMRGSYGSGGSGNWAQLKTYPKEGSTAIGNPDANWDSNDKNAGHYGVNYGTSGCTAMSDPATATYYFDVSNKNLANGKLLNAQNYYTISIDIIRTRFEFYQAHDWTTLNKDQYPATGTLNVPYLDNSDANGTKTTVTYYNNASVSKTSRAVTGNDADTSCNLRFGLIPTEGCWAVPRFNLEVFYFNKSDFRNRYNQLINYKLNENKYTASSYAEYMNALLDAEAYLSNFEITTNTDAAILSKLNDAYNSLQERGDVSLITEKANEGAAECAKNLYTSSSVENFQEVSAECVSSVSNMTEDEERNISKAQVTEKVNRIQDAIDALDPFADFTALDEAYTRADTLLLSLAQRENALYSQQYVEALISAQNAAQRYATLTESERKGIGQKQYQSVLENMAASINTQYDSLNANALELSAFNAMLDLTHKYDKDVYTDEALRLADEKLATVYKTISYNSTEIYVLNVRTQNEIDAVIETVLNALNGSRVIYTVTVPSGVTVTSSGADVTEIEAGKYSVAYGTELTFSVPEEETAWYMNYTSVTASRTRQYQSHGASWTLKVLGNIEITPVSRTEQTPYKVELVRAYDKDESNLKIQCIDYVSSSYTLPQSVPVPHYDFAGYRFDYKVWNPGESVSITGDSRIVADYTHSANPYSIKVTNTAGEYIINEKAYAYNAKIHVEDANAFAWIELIKDNTNTNYRLFGYGSSLDFFLCESTTIKAVASADELRSYGIDPALGYSNIRQDVREYIGTTSIFVGQYVLPENATAKECGILLSTSISYNSDETLVTENSGQKSFYRFKSTKGIETNQYTVRVSNLSDARTVYYRSYLIYEKNGKLYTVYSPVKNTRS